MLERMDLLLRFMEIADAGSLRAAAEKLNISQPALSRSLRQLEDHYGEPLLERHARGIRSTPFGDRLRTHVARLIRDWEISEIELGSAQYRPEQVLRISAGPLWSSVVLPVVIGRLEREMPRLVVELSYLTSEDAVSALNDGRIDISFGGMHHLERTGPINHELVARPFTIVRDCVLAREDHPIHKVDPEDYQAVHDYPWVIYSVGGFYENELLHAVIEKTNAAPPIRVRSTSLFTVLRFVQEGNYLSVMPDITSVNVLARPIKPIPLRLVQREGPTGALYRRSAERYPSVQALLRHCEQFFQENPGPTPPRDRTQLAGEKC
jgi:DNA-binding transcriptional LysR family regulator